MNIKIKHKKVKKCANAFVELPLTGVLPCRNSELRGAIVNIGKINTILKRPVIKLFPIEKIYQGTNETDTARVQKLRREAAVIGELKRKYEF